MPLGMDIMFKSLGVDPAKIIADFESLRTNVVGYMKATDERLSGIEKSQAEILNLLREVVAWKRIQQHQTIAQLQRPTAPPLQNQPPMLQQENP
jgi:hypothetical protein